MYFSTRLLEWDQFPHGKTFKICSSHWKISTWVKFYVNLESHKIILWNLINNEYHPQHENINLKDWELRFWKMWGDTLQSQVPIEAFLPNVNWIRYSHNRNKRKNILHFFISYFYIEWWSLSPFRGRLELEWSCFLLIKLG